MRSTSLKSSTYAAQDRWAPGTIDRQLEDDGEKELASKRATEYRELAARLNYVAQDRPDIQYATIETRRHMAGPRGGDAESSERIARYWAQKERLEQGPQQADGTVRLITSNADADSAGCREAGKNTSGGLLKNGRRCLKTWSATQNIASLPSGGAEFYALVKYGRDTLGLQKWPAGGDTAKCSICRRANYGHRKWPGAKG